MKLSILAATFLAVPVVATAQAPTPAPVPASDAPPSQSAAQADGYGRSPRDLQFLPDQGQLIFTIGYSYDDTTGELKVSQTGQRLLETNTTAHSVPVLIGYGISDEVTIGVSSAYGNSNTKLTYNPILNTPEENTKADGFRDPTLLARWRTLESDAGILDLTFGYSPKLIDRKSGTTTATGNLGRGGDEITLSAEYGARLRGKWQGSVNLGYSIPGKTTSKPASGSGGTETKGDETLSLTARAQYDYSGEGSFYGLLGLNRHAEETITSATTTIVADGYTQTRIGLGHKLLVADNLAVDLNITKALEASQDAKINGNAAKATQSGTTYAIGLIAEF